MGQQAELDEAAGVEEEIDALADGELAPLALAGDAFRAAHPEVAPAAGLEVLDARPELLGHLPL